MWSFSLLHIIICHNINICQASCFVLLMFALAINGTYGVHTCFVLCQGARVLNMPAAVSCKADFKYNTGLCTLLCSIVHI